MTTPRPKPQVGDDKSQMAQPSPNGAAPPFSPPSHGNFTSPKSNPPATSSPPCPTPETPPHDLKPKNPKPEITPAAALRARQLAEMERGLADGRYVAAIESAIARREEWKQLDGYEAQITRKQALQFVWIEQGENEVFKQQMDLADREKALEEKDGEWKTMWPRRRQARK